MPPVKAVEEDPASEPKPTTDGLGTPENTDKKEAKPEDTKPKEPAKDGKSKTPDTLTIIRDKPENADGAKKYVLRVLSGPHGDHKNRPGFRGSRPQTGGSDGSTNGGD